MTELDNSSRPLIAQSWQRVAMSGLFPGASVDDAAIEEVDRRSRLMVAAAPVLDEMAGELEGAGFAVILADRNARLVDLRYGERDLQPKLEQVGTVEGRRFLEETTGTNSIATAFELRRGLAVRGEEHYIEALKKFSCYGQPVVNPVTRRIEGVLDITCLSEDDSPLLAPFVIRSARQIGERLLEESRQAELRIFHSFQDATVRARTSPVIAIGDDILLANTAAVQILEPADHALLRALAVEAPLDREITHDVQLSAGRLLTASVLRIPGSGAALFTFGTGPASRSTTLSPGPAAPIGSVLITGEPGTGRTTAARAAVDGAGTWFDATQVAELGSQAWTEQVRSRLAEPGCVVLEAVDLLPTSLARRTAEDLRSARARVVMTSAPVDDLPPEHAALVSHCTERIELAPLRHRRPEIPALVNKVLEELGGSAQVRFTPAALEALAGQQWAGNLRELHTAVKAASGTRSAGDITVGDLPAQWRGRMTRHLTPLEQAERDAVVKTLRDVGGNKKAAALQLGISRTTLYRVIRSYGIDTSTGSG
ncbi:sigma-54-dependent Fis family transcriptional regulator [Rhodococcus jostii]|uniref:Transcriptional regulator of acetoin/glycerol metabolism n=1 Tax=Rhodococcus jostii TaxID=132919 RepID=A0A1H5D2G2_RHOJO|nr:helix-turn-helix domain-containing protein [Rhodococcus jostii]SED73042.1 Transcriptional regulator of acetoin/glycerol metabolism [Rhodococcus jostii]